MMILNSNRLKTYSQNNNHQTMNLIYLILTMIEVLIVRMVLLKYNDRFIKKKKSMIVSQMNKLTNFKNKMI